MDKFGNNNLIEKIEDWFLSLTFVEDTFIESWYFGASRLKMKIIDFIYHNPLNFIRNTIQYRKFLLDNRWFDSFYLFNMIKMKLEIDAKQYRKNGITVNAEEYAKQMEYCVDTLNRILDDEYEVKCIDDEEFDKMLEKLSGDTDSNNSVDESKDRKILDCLKNAQIEKDSDIRELFDYISKNILNWWD